MKEAWTISEQGGTVQDWDLRQKNAVDFMLVYCLDEILVAGLQLHCLLSQCGDVQKIESELWGG